MIYRMKQNAVGLANICILSTMVLVMISSTFSLWYGMNDIINNYYPTEFQFSPSSHSDKDIKELKTWINNTLDDFNKKPIDEMEYTTLNFAGIEKENSYIIDKANPVYSNSVDDIGTLSFITLDDYNKLYNSNKKLDDNEIFISSNRDKYNYDTLKVFDYNFKIKGHFEDFPIDKYVAANIAKNHVVLGKDMYILNNLYKLQKK